MTVTIDSILQALTDEKIVLRFFATFARFEYALKRAGFLRPQERAEADWDSFADEQVTFTRVVDPTVKEDINYLLAHPPRKQVVEREGNGRRLAWKSVDRSPDTSDERFTLQLVRVVRNNLFHGGKFPPPIGRLDDSARNRHLLGACIAVLEECLTQSTEVRSYFLETA